MDVNFPSYELKLRASSYPAGPPAQTSPPRVGLNPYQLPVYRSNDGGGTWDTLRPKAFPKFLWPSLYEAPGGGLALFNACARAEGGENIQMRAGKFL
jgi:hypothetical protein